MITFDDLNSLYLVENLLLDVGLQKVKDRGDYFQFSSPFREDKNPSMVLYKKNLYCVDFSSGYRKNFFSFVRDVTGKSLFDAAGIDRNSLDSHFFESTLQERKRQLFPERKKSIKINGILDSVEKNPQAIEYCDRRNIFPDFRRTFDIRFMKRGRINETYFGNRLCIPVEENGKKISMEGRDVTGKARTKVLYPKGGSVSTLFNVDNLKKNEPLVVVEGIMDIPKIWKFFTKNVTTTFGIMVTQKQKELLSQFEDIILFPDGDEAGERMIDEFEHFYESEFRVAFIQGRDPGDATVKQIERALTTAPYSTEWYMEKSELFKKENEEKNLLFSM